MRGGAGVVCGRRLDDLSFSFRAGVEPLVRLGLVANGMGGFETMEMGGFGEMGFGGGFGFTVDFRVGRCVGVGERGPLGEVLRVRILASFSDNSFVTPSCCSLR